MRYLHDTPPAPGVDRVQYPGEYEAANRAQASDTLNINPAIWRNLERLAQSLNVAVPTA
ncbi:L-lactate dehydrogenase [compost metagenome]